jgi:hypothetical protein
MAPVANRPSHCNSAWPAITWPRGIEISALKPNFFGFCVGHESGVGNIGALADMAYYCAIGSGDVRIAHPILVSDE